MPIIDKELALAIVKKLKATIRKKTKAHDIAEIYHEGKFVASFGIRRGSRKGAGHDYVPAAIHLSPAEARLLGQCPMSREAWIAKMKGKNLL